MNESIKYVGSRACRSGIFVSGGYYTKGKDDIVYELIIVKNILYVA